MGRLTDIHPVDYIIDHWPSPELKNIHWGYKAGGLIFCLAWAGLTIGALI